MLTVGKDYTNNSVDDNVQGTITSFILQVLSHLLTQGQEDKN